MKFFPNHQATVFYRLTSGLLQSIHGVLFLLIASFFMTIFIFLMMNKSIEKTTKWGGANWHKRAKDGLRAQTKCRALKNAHRHLSHCKSIDQQLSHYTLLEIGSPEKRSVDPKIASVWNELERVITSRKEQALKKKNAFYITLRGRNKERGVLPSEDEPYLQLYGLLEVSFEQNPSERFLRTRLWVAAVDRLPRFSGALHGSLLNQQRLKIGLWPTQTLLEPNRLGRWLIHNFQTITRNDFEAGYLFPEGRILKRAERFLNTWTTGTFGHTDTSFDQDAFWFTFFNGVDHWGFIQWISVFLAIFVLFQLSLRCLMTQMERSLLSYYQKTHPLDIKKEASAITYKLREEITRKRSTFPRFQVFFLLNTIDKEAQDLVEVLKEKVDSSRKIIDFFVSSLSSIGFIGTITGIAFAINQAHQVVTPDEFLRLQAIRGLSTDLALAFSTTFVALVLTLVCDFFAKRQWQSEDSLLEELQIVRQAWAWQEKETPAEQALSSFSLQSME